MLPVSVWPLLSEKAATVLVDSNRVYAVQAVIRPRHSGVNEDCMEEELREDIPVEHVSCRNSNVSKLMIARFFTEVEGADRDW